jgi:hypothetical protein
MGGIVQFDNLKLHKFNVHNKFFLLKIVKTSVNTKSHPGMGGDFKIIEAINRIIL